MGNKSEARAHHYVPQCWLAGFTDTGDSDGMLYVTDLKRKDQWRCKPSGAGHRRDFYRVEDENIADPLAVEKIFSGIETEVAPVFGTLTEERRAPKDGIELGFLVEYLAVQWIRVPAFRSVVRNTFETHVRENVLSSRSAWEKALRRLGVSASSPGANYDKFMEGFNSGEIKFSDPPPAFYIKQGAELLMEIEPTLRKRHWRWLVSPTGQFIGSDNPVAMDGEAGKPIGIANADLLLYPVTRFLTLFGSLEPHEPPPLTTWIIARQNTFMMLTAEEQVYSHRPDFHWLDAHGKCQNDWRLFSEGDFRELH